MLVINNGILQNFFCPATLGYVELNAQYNCVSLSA